MTARLFRLTQMHQRIDDRLRAARHRRGAGTVERTRLALLKARIKARIHQLVLQPALA
jgi:hypothetical protein